jgi:hypothetical protein
MARSARLQRQSRMRSRDMLAAASTATASHIRISWSIYGALLVRNEIKSARKSSVHMMPPSPSNVVEMAELNRPRER